MNLTRTILHRFDPELIHDLTIGTCAVVGKIPMLSGIIGQLFKYENENLETRLGNLTFKNPIGLAAGFDKNATAVSVLQSMGFGFIEVGTVTPKPQPGNPKPRLFRIKEEEAVLNRMGFNNKGIEALIDSLKKTERTVPIGINLGKNKTTPLSAAAAEYGLGMQKAWNLADYFTINISSPNTKDLRDLQKKENLRGLLEQIMKTRERLAQGDYSNKQIWLKIAPDLADADIESICNASLEAGIDALVVSNTTITRDIQDKSWQNQEGGLSGKPLFELSNEVLSKVIGCLGDRIPIVGVGGIFNWEDAARKLSLGARLVQIYTGMIYEGPGIVKRIKKGLAGHRSSLSNSLSSKDKKHILDSPND